MDGPDMIKLLVTRERELDRERTRALARQQWAKVIEVDARINECQRMRKEVTETYAITTPAPTAH